MRSSIHYRLAVAIGSIVSASLTACGPQADAPTAAIPNQPSMVSVAWVKREMLNENVAALGTVTAWQELVMSAQASGLAVIDVRIGENDRVKQGDILLRLDDRILQAQIAQQRAAIEEAQANLESAAERLVRANVLIATQAIIKESAEEKRTSVKTSQAKLDQAKASLEQLQAQLDQTRIIAPADGYIATKPVVIGAVVQVGTELVRMIRDARLEIETKIPETNLSSIHKDQIVHVRDPKGRNIEARVRDILLARPPRTTQSVRSALFLRQARTVY